MSLNAIDTRKAHADYCAANPIFQGVVDRAYSAARKAIEAAGLICANDDRAEELVAAIAQYIRKSNR